MTQTKKAILKIGAQGKQQLRVNYSRRMYAIIRRYTPDVVEGDRNECFADITGLRTFFKMTYAEIASEIQKTLAKEIGVRFVLSVATSQQFDRAKTLSKKTSDISTYKELNRLFSSFTFKTHSKAHPRLSIPFIGQVS